MKDEFLLNIALITAGIGIILLLFLAFYDKIPEKKFNEITSSDVDTKVKVTGIVLQQYIHNNSMTLKLKQECTMDVFLFEKLNVTVGSNVSVTGSVQEYNGKMELMADSIVVK